MLWLTDRYRRATKIDSEFGVDDCDLFAERTESELRSHLQGTDSRIKSAQDAFRKLSDEKLNDLMKDTKPRRRKVCIC
jgi:hypothetical protein